MLVGLSGTGDSTPARLPDVPPIAASSTPLPAGDLAGDREGLPPSCSRRGGGDGPPGAAPADCGPVGSSRSRTVARTAS